MELYILASVLIAWINDVLFESERIYIDTRAIVMHLH